MAKLCVGGTKEFDDVYRAGLRETYVGKQWHITGLTSERGQAFNGKSAECVGVTFQTAGIRDGKDVDIRLHLALSQGKKKKRQVFKVKISNVMKPGDSPCQPPLCMPTSKERMRLIRIARQGIERTRDELKEGSDGRPDWLYRKDQMERCLEAFGRGETLQLKCKDVGRVCNDIISGKRTHSDGPFLRMVQQLAPPCVGDGFFRIEDCTRGGAPDNQVMRRFQEYMPSGFCISCQQRYMEQRGF